MATLCLAGLAVAWWSVRQFTSIVVLGILLAYILNPVIGWLTRRAHLRRGVATVIVYATLAAALLAGLAVGLQMVALAITSGSAQRGLNRLLAALRDAAPHGYRLMGIEIPLHRWLEPGSESLIEALQNVSSYLVAPESASRMLGYATSFAAGFAYTALALLVTFFVSMYIAADGGRCLAWLEDHVPPAYRPVYRTLIAEVDAVWRRFFLGELLLALVIGLLTLAGLMALGVPYAPALALIAAVLEVVPRLGPTLSVVPAVLVTLVLPSTTFPHWSPMMMTFVVVVLYVGIQQLENNFLVPRILGQSTNVPPVIVLVGALAGAKLAGVPGILLAPPILGTARVVGSWIFHKLVTEPVALAECRPQPASQIGREATPPADGEPEQPAVS